MLWNEVKSYRDEFVAHLGGSETTKVPNMNLPHFLVEFYYEKLQAEFPHLQSTKTLPVHMDTYYQSHLDEATRIFKLAREGGIG
jgi:hypothetical protein